MTAQADVLWHYTTGVNVLKILGSEEIVPSRGWLPPGVRPAVWFTRSPEWDATADKTRKRGLCEILFTTRGTEAVGRGLFRIGARPETAPATWTDYRRDSHAPAALLRGLADTARKQGVSPSDWRISWDPVPRHAWLGVEVWREDAWIPAPESASALVLPPEVRVPSTDEMRSLGWVKDVRDRVG